MLIHQSGDWIAATYPLVVTSKDETAQGYGSAVTYARRYGLSALMGVIADTDDDGNAASKAPKPAAA
ncbi:ERF family protein, partial [Escherichia coli]|uniref:ERF family protein n=1 Tax=Escherichia coli TaxID=562 RepID=UPI00207B4861